MPKPLSLMPGPRSLPIIGSALEYSGLGAYSFERMHIAKRENLARYGKIYKEKLGRHIVQLFDPADIERVHRVEGKLPVRPVLPLLLVAHRRDGKPLGLGSLNGEAWWSVRSAVQQAMMRTDAALPYLPTQNRVADDFLRLVKHHLREAAAGEIDDLLLLITKYTMEAFGAVCFQARIGCLQHTVPSSSRADAMMTSTNRMFQAVQKTTYSFPFYAMYRTQEYRQFIEASEVCQSIAKSYVAEALASSHTDHVTDTDDVTDSDHVTDSHTGSHFLQTLLDKNSSRLSIDQIVQLTIDLFTAGIDSTAYAITFCLYNLSRNVDKQRHLLAELDSVLTRDALVTADAILRLRYLKACVKESFRLQFPVEGGAVRELERDVVLSDYLVPSGTLVSFNYQTLCLREEYFESADQFIPERWLKDTSHCPVDHTSSNNGSLPGQLTSSLRQAPKFSVLPFGYGSRSCIGQRFALQEIYLAVIKILQHYRLEYRDDKPVGMINRVFTMPDRPVRIAFIPRTEHKPATATA